MGCENAMNDKIFYFLFFIDVSGSMLGKNISVVNAAITECINVLQQSYNERKSNIQVGIYTFSERVYTAINLQPIQSIASPLIRVIPDSEGFYALSSYLCLYNGMEKLFHRMAFNSEKDNAFIFLASDGKSTDSTYNATETIKQYPIYQKAYKYIALTDDNPKQIKDDVIAFIDGNISNVIPLEQLPDVITKLQVLLESV